jgi:hypothetical protein
MAYPVTYDVEPQLHDRNRLTVLFRIILAIPQLILVGGPAFVLGCGCGFHWGSSGILRIVAGVMAIIAWFAILFASTHPRDLCDFVRYFMSWRARAVAYMARLRDDYPPFGEGAYPVTYDVAYPDMPRNKVGGPPGLLCDPANRRAVLHRHRVVHYRGDCVVCDPLTGSCRQASTRSPSGYLRWSLRVESYLLLVRDEYPPFSLEP